MAGPLFAIGVAGADRTVIDDDHVVGEEMLGRSGRPLGLDAFLEMREQLLGRNVKPRRPGRPIKDRT